jgi:hypothetical protein
MLYQIVTESVQITSKEWNLLKCCANSRRNCKEHTRGKIHKVHNYHPWNPKILAIVDRWSLFRGQSKLGLQKGGLYRQGVAIQSRSLFWVFPNSN